MIFPYPLASLKSRILAVVIVVMIAGMSALAARVTSALQADVESLLIGQLSTMANYVAGDIENKIALRINLLEALAIKLAAKDLRVRARAEALLEDQHFPLFMFPSGVSVVDTSGAALATVSGMQRGIIGNRLEHMDRYLPQMQGCKTPAPAPVYDAAGAQPVVVLAVPICDDDGRVLGAVASMISLSDADLFGQIEKKSAVQGSYLMLVSRRDRVVVSINDHKRILEPMTARSPLTARRLDPKERFEGAGTGVNPKGLGVYTVSKNLQNIDWYVLAAVPVGVAFKPIDNIKTQIAVAASLLTFFACALLYCLLRRFLAPLESAGRAMARMTSGEQPLARLPVRRNDEIGCLIHNFNLLVSERKAVEQRIDFIAHHDALTGLPSRLLLQTRFDEAAAYADEHSGRVGVLFLDLDNFKTINDALGHAVGDELLKAVAAILGDCIGPRDTLGRFGGDEYLIVLPDLSDAACVMRVLDKVQARLAAPVIVDGMELLTSVSAGAALYPDDGADFAALYKGADGAMYQAKEAGKNTHRFFDPQRVVDGSESVAMRSELKRALDRREFVLHYQPQVDLRTGAAFGVEALIRWQHPELGLIAPGKFIAIAEESGLIVPMGEWVIREVCRQGMAWRQMGLPDLVIAVNLSAVQFRRDNLESTLVSALSQSGFPPELLELELTESILIRDTERVLQTIQRFKKMGLKLSIDDFGTGYSSMAYLKRFPVDKIKIDRSFICDLGVDAEDVAIVTAIIQLAKSLKLQTIAEGVEDQGCVRRLHSLGCDEAQGYFFGKPMPAGQIPDYIARSCAITLS